MKTSRNGKKGTGDCMFEWGQWTRIDLRKPKTLPPADTSLLLYVEGEGQVVGKIVDKRYWEKTVKATHYLYHNTHRPIRGHKVWWSYLPKDPK